jgi:hypothetical protein
MPKNSSVVMEFKNIPNDVRTDFIAKYFSIKELSRIQRVDRSFKDLAEKALYRLQTFSCSMFSSETNQKFNLLLKNSPNIRKIELTIKNSCPREFSTVDTTPVCLLT